MNWTWSGYTTRLVLSIKHLVSYNGAWGRQLCTESKEEREGAEKEGREGGREGKEMGWRRKEERKWETELQVPSGAQDPKFRLSFQDPPVKSCQELVERLAGFVAPMPGLESQFHIHYICNLGQCTPYLIGPSTFISKMRMVRIVHHWALERIKLLGTKVLRRVTGTYQVLTAFLCSVWNFLSNETKTSCLWKLLAKCLHNTFHMDL